MLSYRMRWERSPRRNIGAPDDDRRSKVTEGCYIAEPVDRRGGRGKPARSSMLV